jgi:hypothetical protein
MKTLTLNILKKNRVYFAATTENGYNCKLKITPESADLIPGEHTLVLNDLSIVSKYGRDLIFEVVGKLDEVGICTLKHFMYNNNLVEECRDLGGKWDATQKVWIFSNIVADAVEELDYNYNNDIVGIEITALKSVYGYKKPVYFAGYPIAKASGRDTGAVLGDDICKMSGTITSSGSRNNWYTEVCEGAIFRLRCPREFAVSSDSWDVKVLGPTVEQLMESFIN